MNSGTATTYGTGAGKIYLGPVGTSAIIGTNASYFVFDQDIRLGTGTIGSNSGNLILKTGTTTQMTLSSSTGNIGMGVAPSATEKLLVAGHIRGQGNAYFSTAARLVWGQPITDVSALSIVGGNSTYNFSTIEFKSHLHFRRVIGSM